MALKINRLPTNSPTVTTVQGGTEPNGRELVSPWLYLAGMLVTLSGLFAVNFGIEDQSFVFLTYGLAIGGYVISYLLRIARISLRALQVPLVVCIGLMFFAMLSSERGLSWFAPSGMVEDRAKNLQLVFVWLAIVHSYLLNNDAAVLFACVPCITMIALVSTISPDPTVQSAFLIFIGASTFLLVHENYLRTRHATMKGRTEAGERRLFGGQLQQIGRAHV